MQRDSSLTRDGRRPLRLVAPDDGGGPTERDVLAQLADRVDDAIAQVPDESTWRASLAKVSRTVRAAAYCRRSGRQLRRSRATSPPA
jgi:hypothetical protein